MRTEQLESNLKASRETQTAEKQILIAEVAKNAEMQAALEANRG